MDGRRTDRKQVRVVGVINIGTYCSDVALSLKHNPANLVSPITWPTSTSILFNKEQEFVAYGNEAEKRYATHCSEGKEKDYYFFRRFKMDLYDSLINQKSTMNDVAAKSMSPIYVLSAIIKYVWQEMMMQQLRSKGVDEKSYDIWLVLIVPDTLKKPSIASVQEAARRAGVNMKTFRLITEAEAACVWCYHLYKNVLKYVRLDVPIQTKTDTLVVDTGCDRDTRSGCYHVVDITVNVIRTVRNRESLMEDSSFKLGRDPVDKQFRDFLYDVFGSDVFDEFKEKNGDEYEELFLVFYTKLRPVTEREECHVNLRIPCELLQLFERRRGVSFDEFIKTRSGLRFRRHILRVCDKRGTELINKAFENIIASIKDTLKELQMATVRVMVIIGWLNKSEKFNTLVRESFPGKHIIIPKQPELALMKGAVLSGHDITASDVDSQPQRRKHKLFSEF